ncbi:hypothetical protein [[Bacillus] enclensis]|uniref:hypothetical protein n=1 Tax=[Bacillus] enclensis TaxID=1402860 RepID=UPI0018DE3558|nr:hypothetical protein [[Bacillus] enclensis]MBH9968476.1 hypothetical protein [[Bacillus] enclensis]
MPRKVKSAYKAKKAWNERVEVSPFLINYQGKLYYYIMLSPIIGQLKGAMVIDKDGGVPLLEEAKPIIFRMNGYNNMINFANKEMKETLKIPVGMMKRIEKQVLKVYPNITDDHELYHEINLLISMCRTIYQNHEKLVSLFKEIAAISQRVQKRNKVLDEESFSRLFDIFTEWHFLLFIEKRIQLDNYVQLPKIIENVNSKSNGKNLTRLLRNLHIEKRKEVLEEYLDGVIEPSIGNAKTLPYTAEGIEKFKEMKSAEAFIMFETNIVPKIRN